MKKLVTVKEVEGEGLVGLLGKRVMLFCLNYIYVGTLEGVNDADIKLANAAVVYATGAFTQKKFSDAQPLPKSLYIRMRAIESYSETDME